MIQDLITHEFHSKSTNTKQCRLNQQLSLILLLGLPPYLREINCHYL